jgi:hypoxanthine-guanine phosphoribosyltransferase
VQALEHISDSHTDPKVEDHCRKTAIRFKKSQPKEREGIVVAVLKGLLIFLTLLFYIVGMVFHTAREFMEGLGFSSKSTEHVAKKLTYEGGPFFKH